MRSINHSLCSKFNNGSFEVLISGKDGSRIHPIKLGNNNCQDINVNSANNLVNNGPSFWKEYNIFIPSHKLEVDCVISIEPDIFIEEIVHYSVLDQPIIHARRINRNNKDTKKRIVIHCIIVIFEVKQLPKKY